MMKSSRRLKYARLSPQCNEAPVSAKNYSAISSRVSRLIAFVSPPGSFKPSHCATLKTT
jgi:hypothetical protein